MGSLESLRTVWKVSGQSGKFPDSVESFRTVWKVPGQSGKFLDSLERFMHFSICRENNLRTFGIHVAEKIYALRPESFCASKSADCKVETF